MFDEKSYENMLTYVLYKTLIGANPLHIMFDKVDGFIRNYDRTKCLLLYGPEKYDAIFLRIRYLIRLKSHITYVDSHNYAKTKIDTDDDLPLEKTLSPHVIILMKSVFK